MSHSTFRRKMNLDFESLIDPRNLKDKPVIHFCIGNCNAENYDEDLVHLLNCPPRIVKRLKSAGLEKKVINTLISKAFNNSKKAMEAVNKYYVNDFKKGRCLILSGDVGIGKTVAGGSIMYKTGYGQKIYSLDLIDVYFNKEAFGVIKKTKFLLFDDLGAETFTGILKQHFKAALDALIYYREGNLLATVITTNKDLEDFKDLGYTDRTISRLSKGWCTFEVIKDKDMRKEGKSDN